METPHQSPAQAERPALALEVLGGDLVLAGAAGPWCGQEQGQHQGEETP